MFSKIVFIVLSVELNTFAVMAMANLLPSSSMVSLAIESKSLVRCLATISGWLPLDKMSNKSADEEK